MKTKGILLLALCCVLFCHINTAKAQTFEETIVYINELLKQHGYRIPLPQIVGENHKPEYDAYDQIEVSDDGKFIMKRTLDYYETKEKKISSSVTCYLKQVMYQGTKDFDSYYSVSLKTKVMSDFFLVTSHDDGSTIGRSDAFFLVNSYLVAQRLTNALKHLIELGEKKPNFLEKDPFDN